MNHLVVAALAAAAIVLNAAPAVCQEHQHHMDMPGMDMSGIKASALPHEGGQAGFAAIQEVVALLRADPKTDWSKVNIDMLRQHLVDMDNVTIRAHVVTNPVAGGARFDISGDSDAVRQSIQRMVASHTAMADGEDGQRVVSTPTSDGATLTVTGSGEASEAKIRALGFFGMMTSGVDHQLHHLMMAKGQMRH